MRNFLLLLPLLALAAPAAAQHTELVGRAGLSLLHFGGPDATASSFATYYASDAAFSYTNSPYGRRPGLGVGAGVRVQHVGQRAGLLALDLGYEWLRSRTSITRVYYSSSSFSSFIGAYDADGSTYLASQNLTAFAGLGHRFALGAVNVDALAGPELGFGFGFREAGRGTYNGGTTWTTDMPNRARSLVDVRLRADATVWYHRAGINASYSWGLLNYQRGLLGASPEVYARVLRLGVAYRLL